MLVHGNEARNPFTYTGATFASIHRAARSERASTIIMQFIPLLLCSVVIGSTHALTIAITGSSQGIGLSAAKTLISEGHTVIHACRSMERAEIARSGAGGGIPMVCDLADMGSIRKFAEECKVVAPTLDVLCLNAAIAPSTKSSAPKRTVDGFEEAIGVNHIGHFLLANLLQKHLTDGPTKRLVVTASSVHDPDQPGGAVNGKSGATLGDLSGFAATSGPMVMCDGATEYDGSKVYKDSKLCNMLFCREAQKRWGETGLLSIVSFSPGFIPSSGLFREPRKDNFLAASAFAFAAEKLLGFAVPIDVGGDRLAYLATASEEEVPSGSYLSAPTGAKGYTRADGFDDGLISSEASDDAKGAKLWELTASAVGISS